MVDAQTLQVSVFTYPGMSTFRNVGTGGKKKHQQHNSLYITLTARSIIYRERFSILSQTEAASGESQAEPVVNYKTTFLFCHFISLFQSSLIC